ncbi:MAG: acyl-CoA synthetase [Actinomycetota bacterium]
MNDASPNMTDYEATHESFKLEVPEYFNYTRDVIDAWAERSPDKVALLAVGPDGTDERRINFGELSERSKRAAAFLSSLGVAKGDRIFVMLQRVPEWYDVLLGCFRIGAIPMPGTPLLTERDIEFRITVADAVAAITDVEGAIKVDAVRDSCAALEHSVVVGGDAAGWTRFDDPGVAGDGEADVETRADDPLLIYFTSGTVAYPKMVLHTQASYGIGHEITARFWQDLKADDLHWTFSDTGWAKAAWGKLFGQWSVGASNFLWDVRGKPDFELMLGLIEKVGVTTFCAPPTVYRALVLMDLGGRDWSQLRHCVSAGEPLNPEVIKVWKEATGLTIYDGFGQTETVNVLANYRCMPIKPGSMGKPTPGFDVCVVDDEGGVLDSGSEGHVAIRVKPTRPVGLFQEYWRDPSATSGAFRGDWYYTGDRAFVDEDGYFWFVGRSDDVIISAGYRIGPFEVESALVEHEAVAEAAVVGKPDAARGQIVKAFVVLAPGFEASDDLASAVQDHVKSVTAPYKYPREIDFVEDLPKTVSGKIRRVELRERAAAE